MGKAPHADDPRDDGSTGLVPIEHRTLAVTEAQRGMHDAAPDSEDYQVRGEAKANTSTSWKFSPPGAVAIRCSAPRRRARRNRLGTAYRRPPFMGKAVSPPGPVRCPPSSAGLMSSTRSRGPASRRSSSPGCGSPRRTGGPRVELERPGGTEHRRPQIRKHPADLGEQIVPVGSFERVDARLVPPFIPVVGDGDGQLDPPDEGAESWVEEERKREPVARGRVADPVRRRAVEAAGHPVQHVANVADERPGHRRAGTQLDRDLISRPPASSCSRMVSIP